MAILFPFRRGDTILASVEAVTTTKVVLYVRVAYADGTQDTLVMEITHSVGDGSHEHNESEPFLKDGVVEEVCHLSSSGMVRKEFYVETCRRWGVAHFNLCYGYVYPDHSVPLGFHENKLSGKGNMSWRTVADDVTPVDITELLAAANVFRKVHGFVWYYNCAAEVADRILRAIVRAPGLSLPTGFTLAEQVVFPHSTDLSLQNGQEGILYSYGQFASRNDAGSVATENVTTNPQIWPVWVKSNDLIEIQFELTNAHVDDRHSIFIFQEEWID